MENTKQNFFAKQTKILKYFYKEMKKTRWALYLTFFLYGINIILGEAYIPVLFKKLVDMVSSTGEYSLAIKQLLIIGVIWFLVRIFRFSAMYSLSFFESHLVKDLQSSSYRSFLRHSHDFFSNNFTGSLVDKATRLGKNSIKIFDLLLFQYFGIAVSLISILFVLFKENTKIAFIFLAFTVVYTFIVSLLAKKIGPKYLERSKINSKLTGIISDSFSIF